MIGQIELTDYLTSLEKTEKSEILTLGDIVYLVKIGKIEKHMIASTFYCDGYRHSTDRMESKLGGHDCFGENELGGTWFTNLHEAEKQATHNLTKCKYIEIPELKGHVTYTDGRIMASVGIYENMVYVKDWFLYPLLTESKNPEKDYEIALEKIKKRDGTQCENKKPKRLYWSKHGFYTAVEYVLSNG